MTRPSGKVAIITGSANGLGEAMAKRKSEEGAAVAVLDRAKGGGERVAGKHTAGARAAFFACNVSREEDISSAISAVAERFVRLDALINDAGVEGVNKPTHELSLMSGSM